MPSLLFSVICGAAVEISGARNVEADGVRIRKGTANVSGLFVSTGLKYGCTTAARGTVDPSPVQLQPAPATGAGGGGGTTPSGSS